MCNNCYHTAGRNKKAWKCGHIEKPHYALGICQTCYQYKYSKIRNRSTKSKKLVKKVENIKEIINENIKLNQNIIIDFKK